MGLDDPPVDRPSRSRQVQHRLTDDEADHLVRKYQAGRTIVELASEFRIHKTTVSGLLRRHGISTGTNARRLSDEDVRLAAMLYNDGCSLVDISKRFGVCDTTIFREFRKAGVPTRPRNGASHDDH